MKFLRRMAAVILIALLCVCVFGGFVVPEDMDKSIVTIYSTDGRILQMRENDAQQYLNDGWTKNFKDVMTKVWKSDGSSKSILKGQTALYTNSGWSADKGDVTAIMTDKDGNEKEIFKDNIGIYKEKGWKLKRENKQEDNIESAVKAVALTFDDGPNPSTTNRLLDILKKYNVKATFFMLGERVSSGRECIKRMYDEGMEIGSHTYSHKQLTKLSYDNIKSEIDKTNKAISEVIGENPTVIRPPYGSYNDNVKSLSGMPVILWSVDTLDWKSKNADAIFKVVTETTKDGSVLLFHDIYSTSVDAVERIIPELKKRGYEMVTVSELAELKGKSMNPGGVYTNF